jgi:hypothetical protein
MVWRLYAKYLTVDGSVYESELASQVYPMPGAHAYP